MDQPPPADDQNEHLDADAAMADGPVVEETSTEYLGRWNHLVSTTNWQKGRIICEWRRALIEAEASADSYTDEAWSQRVGNVSPQHVGRLRRVYERFGSVCEQYTGLYWSHFQVALDWPDAEMWLEGGVQNGWSVAQMRQQRWEAIGAPPEKKPRPEDIITGEVDEDVDAGDDGATQETITDSLNVVRDAEAAEHDASQSPPFQTDGPVDGAPGNPGDGDLGGDESAESAVDPVRPFEDLPCLPPDLDEALEAFKLAILHHKVTQWQEVSCDDVLAVLTALKHLALAPSQE